MDLSFYKYQGAGNDFILIDERDHGYALSTDQIRFLCDRHFGIGADGLMLLQLHETLQFQMVYYNSDGLESTMCGNGGRCMIAFAQELGLIDTHARFMAVDGEHEGHILDTGLIRLKMQDTGLPVRKNDLYYIHTGSPHAVKFVERTQEYPVVGEGRNIRYSPDFQPGGVNVDFVAIHENIITIRTYERGVEDETLACGTGVTAAALTMAALNPELASPVRLNAVGGELSVSFNRAEHGFCDIWLEGPAKKVFTGMIQLV